MQVSTKYGFAFLCNPKCASTSVESAIETFCNMNLKGPKLKHLDARDYFRLLGPIFHTLFPSSKVESFCLVREPIQRMRSWYAYRARIQLKEQNSANYTGDISFAEFLESCISDVRPPYARLKSQYDFLKLKDGKLGVDRIFPIERLDLVEEFIFTKTGVRVKIPRKNRSGKADQDLSLDPGLEERVRFHYKNDFLIHELAKKHAPFLTRVHAAEFVP